jgi:DNA-binding ferritin-like protein
MMSLPDDCFDQEGMLSTLAHNYDMLADSFATLAEESERIGDDLTMDLAVERGRANKKQQWLLKSNLTITDN